MHGVLYLSVGSCKGVWCNPINRSVVVVRSLLCDEHNVRSEGVEGLETIGFDLTRANEMICFLQFFFICFDEFRVILLIAGQSGRAMAFEKKTLE